MNKERKPLTLSEIHEFDIKKVMENIEYLDTLVYKCDARSVLEMLNARNGLSWLEDRGLIGASATVLYNKRLKDIGEKFKAKCGC